VVGGEQVEGVHNVDGTSLVCSRRVQDVNPKPVIATRRMHQGVGLDAVLSSETCSDVQGSGVDITRHVVLSYRSETSNGYRGASSASQKDEAACAVDSDTGGVVDIDEANGVLVIEFGEA